MVLFECVEVTIVVNDSEGVRRFGSERSGRNPSGIAVFGDDSRGFHLGKCDS